MSSPESQSAPLVEPAGRDTVSVTADLPAAPIDAGLAVFREALHNDFTIVDVQREAAVYEPRDARLDLWPHLELAREVARRGTPEIIAEEPPLVLLAIPVILPAQTTTRVALGAFLSTGSADADALAASAATLGFASDELAGWKAGQHAWQPDVLLRMATLLIEQQLGRREVKRLRSEVEQITTQMLDTYEEITLLHRLTQNLKISRRDTELGRLALEWLSAVMPVEGLALKLNAVTADRAVSHDIRTSPVILRCGKFPISNADFDRFVLDLGTGKATEPVVVNRRVTSDAAWPYPAVREAVAVRLCEGEKSFGHLVAINHSEGDELGTVEASLASSVAAILGIHGSNTDLYRRQAEFLAGMVRALTSAIDAKDPYTCGHSDRVARIAVRLAQQLGADAETLNTLFLSGLLHDIGKIGVDDRVLRKPGKLTPAEFEQIKRHPELGYYILRDLKQLDRVLPVVLHHHENWDGSGYPHGLSGHEIPELARIVAVADGFDAMSSDRPYRSGMPIDRLEEIFRNGSGKQWDAEVIAAYFAAREDIIPIVNQRPHNFDFDFAQWSMTTMN